MAANFAFNLSNVYNFAGNQAIQGSEKAGIHIREVTHQSQEATSIPVKHAHAPDSQPPGASSSNEVPRAISLGGARTTQHPNASGSQTPGTYRTIWSASRPSQQKTTGEIFNQGKNIMLVEL
jgi:hypothetical protein